MPTPHLYVVEGSLKDAMARFQVIMTKNESREDAPTRDELIELHGLLGFIVATSEEMRLAVRSQLSKMGAHYQRGHLQHKQ